MCMWQIKCDLIWFDLLYSAHVTNTIWFDLNRDKPLFVLLVYQMQLHYWCDRGVIQVSDTVSAVQQRAVDTNSPFQAVAQGQGGCRCTTAGSPGWPPGNGRWRPSPPVPWWRHTLLSCQRPLYTWDNTTQQLGCITFLFPQVILFFTLTVVPN